MKHSPLPFEEAAIDNDDFVISTMLSRLETGEDIDNEEFSVFVKRCLELIQNLQKLVLS